MDLNTHIFGMATPATYLQRNTTGIPCGSPTLPQHAEEHQHDHKGRHDHPQPGDNQHGEAGDRCREMGENQQNEAAIWDRANEAVQEKNWKHVSHTTKPDNIEAKKQQNADKTKSFKPLQTKLK